MDMRKLMQQAQEMQTQLQEEQEKLAKERVQATAGGGMVEVEASGSGDILKIKIDPQAVDPEDVEILEEMVLAAVNEAQRMASDMANSRLGSVTGGMGLPGM